MTPVKNILIVDDEADILEILQEEFKMEGHHVQTALCGDDAVKLIDQHSFDIVVSDYRMPRGNGLVVLDKVNTIAQDQRPKFIFITGQSDLSEEEAYKRGVVGFFRKPFDFSELLNLVNSSV